MEGIKWLSVKKRKEFYKDIAENWGKEQSKKIAKRWGTSPIRVRSAVAYLRKKGVSLPKTSSGSKFLTPEFIEELNALAKKKNGKDKILKNQPHE